MFTNFYHHYQNLLSNPFFRYSVRHVRGGRTVNGLRRYNQWANRITIAIIIVPFLLFHMAYGFTQYAYFDDRAQISTLYVTFVTVASIAAFLVVDIVTLFYGVVTLRSEFKKRDTFELLRATTVDPELFVAGRLGIAQLRAWRVFVIMRTARLTCWALMWLHFVWTLLYTLIDINRIEDVIDSLRFDTVTTVGFFTILSACFLGASYIILAEPLWRFRMLSALGISAAARFRNTTVMWLSLSGGFILILILQGGFFIGAVSLALWTGSQTYDLIDSSYVLRNISYNGDILDVVTLAIAVVPLFAGMPFVWSAQRRMTRWRLNVATSRAFTRWS